MEFENKTALITGGSAGIGLAIAKNLAGRGCKLILLARRKEKLELAKKELEQKYHIQVSIFQCDIGNLKQIKETFKEIKEKISIIHFLVNNAGFNSSKTIDVLSEEEFDKEIAVALRGTYLITQQVYPLMKKGG